MNCLIPSKTQDIAWAKNVADFARTQNANDTADTIEQLIRDYDNRKVIVSLVGLNKRGKSTLCNALLGRKDDLLAPIAWQPATSIISTFANQDALPEADKSNADGNTPRAFVNFENHTRREVPCENIRDYVLEERNPENRKQVESLEVYGNFDLDRDMVLQDLPGDDSLYAYHAQVVYRYLPNADIVLFLSSATDPIQQSELGLLKKVADGERRKIFFVINKADACEDSELAEAQLHNQKVLQNAGIAFENRLFCISAKQMMETGEDGFDSVQLFQEVRDYLTANKLNLLRDGFRNAVRLAISELAARMKLNIEANKMSPEELKKNIEKLQETNAHCQEVLKHSLDNFLQNWETMLDTFEGQLPQLESNVQAQVKAYIENIPMMDLNKKTIDKLPPKITEVIEMEFQGALTALETQVKKNLSELDREMKAIDEYLANNSINVIYRNNNSSHTISLVTGIGFTGIGGFMATAAAGLPALLTQIPLIGGVLSGIAGVVTVPLMLAAAPILTGGIILLAIPVFSFVRGKKHSKADVMKDVENQLKKAFADIRTNKLETLRNQGERLYSELEREFRQKMAQTQEQLNQALAQKQQLLLQENETRLLEASYERLTDMLEAQ